MTDNPMQIMENNLDSGRKDDTGKTRLELIPPTLLWAVGEVLGFGANKYAARNWEKGIQYGRVYGALQRHLNAFWAGDDIDAESTLPHLWHAACCIAFLIEFEELGREDLDDRSARSVND